MTPKQLAAAVASADELNDFLRAFASRLICSKHPATRQWGYGLELSSWVPEGDSHIELTFCPIDRDASLSYLTVSLNELHMTLDDMVAFCAAAHEAEKQAIRKRKEEEKEQRRLNERKEAIRLLKRHPDLGMPSDV
jgi:hypothetical protein